MNWKDLPKQKQLLIFMLNREASTSLAFTMEDCADEVVANGISKSKKSLSNMIYTLGLKGFIKKSIVPGPYVYYLTLAGQNEAKYWIAQCDDGMEVPESTDSLRETEEQCRNIEAYAKRLEQIIVGLKDELFKLNDQPKQFDGLVKAQAKEIERLKAALKNAEAENGNLQVSEKMVRDVAEYFDEEKTKLRNERDSLQKSLYNLSEENVKLTMKAASLKKSLSNALVDLDKKNKRIEHLEDSIELLKTNLAKMAEWAEQMKNGSN